MARVELFFEVEGLRINARAILSRLEMLFADRPPLYATGPYDFVVRQEAIQCGWQMAQRIEEARIFILFAPGDRITIEYLESALQSMPQILGGCIVRETEKQKSDRCRVFGAWSIRRAFTPYHTIRHFVNYVGRRLGLPRFLIAFFTGVFRSTGVTEIVGGRPFKVRIRNNQELYFGRGAAPDPRLLAPGFDARDLAMSFFWVGHFGIAPGTVASVVTVAALMAVWFLQPAVLTFTAGLTALLATIICVVLEPWCVKRYFSDDARQVVLDEVAGQSLLIALLPSLTSPLQFLIGLVLFRLFDVLKPGIHWIEKRNVRGKIVWDDLLAGLYGAVVAWLLWFAGLWPLSKL